MIQLTLVQLKAYQARTFCLNPELLLKTPQDAIRFVNERGFVFFWPVKGFTFPSLWAAVAGDRPVPDDHDDPANITWSWKDDLLDQHVWYYGRVLKHKNAFISYDLLPSFYALSPNYGSPEDDIEEDYRLGHLTLESKLIFDTLLEKGPLDTINLRKEAHLTGQNSKSPFKSRTGPVAEGLPHPADSHRRCRCLALRLQIRSHPPCLSRSDRRSPPDIRITGTPQPGARPPAFTGGNPRA